MEDFLGDPAERHGRPGSDRPEAPEDDPAAIARLVADAVGDESQRSFAARGGATNMTSDDRQIGNIRTELGKVYRLAHAGQMDWQDACAASRMLRELRFVLESTNLEQRLDALEAAFAERDQSTRRPNGQHGQAPRMS